MKIASLIPVSFSSIITLIFSYQSESNSHVYFGSQSVDKNFFSMYYPMLPHENSSHKPNWYFVKSRVSKSYLISPEESFSLDTIMFFILNYIWSSSLPLDLKWIFLIRQFAKHLNACTYFPFIFNQEESRKQSLNENVTTQPLRLTLTTFVSALTCGRACFLTISSPMGCNFQPIMKIASALADPILIYIIHDSAWLNFLAKSFKDKFESRAQIRRLCGRNITQL